MRKMWLDDCRPAPEGWHWVKSVHEAKIYCCQTIHLDNTLNYDIISLDHDAGSYAWNGGDYIELLNWLEKKQELENWNIITKFHFHSANPVGIANMRRIIKRNGWTEII